MNKQILVLLFTLNSTFIHTMENYVPSFLKKFFSYNQTPHKESALVSNLRINKEQFESPFARRYKNAIENAVIINAMTMELNSPTIILSSTASININPTNFLQHCYDQRLHQNDNFISMEINALDTFEHPHFLKKCQNARINGYSALSTAMLAPNVFFKNRRKFIQEELINRKFKPTPKDIQLAKLIFYDEIIKETKSISLSLKAKKSKQKFIYLLRPNSPASWSVLPKEIRQLIAYFIIEILKKEENCWLLPGF
jgi:hypothetical protein